MDPRETDDVLHRALKALPSPEAPRTLLPRVMAAVAERRLTHRPAASTWSTWPRAAQAASLAALVLLTAAVVWGWPAAQDFVSGSDAWGAVRVRVTSVASSVLMLARLISIIWDALLQPIVGYLLVWIVLMSGACAAFGAALERVALGGASHS